MPLRVIVDESQFGELSEVEKAYYKKGDGDESYVLDIEGVDSHPTVKALRNGHTRSKQERDEAKARVKALENRFGAFVENEEIDFSDIDPDRVESMMPYLKGERDIPDPNAPPKDGKGQTIDLDKIKANARKPLERELADANARATKAETQLQNLLIDSALNSAMSEIGVASVYQKGVQARFRSQVKIEEGDDGNPVAVIDGEYGEQPVGKYLKEWANTDEGKAHLEATINGGGGIRQNGNTGGKGKNPWSKENWSMSEQARIYREQGREVASRMAGEHGHRVL